jgi:hypothetical protein
MWNNLTPEEAGRLDGVLFGALSTMNLVGATGAAYEAMWHETADVLDDLRAQHTHMASGTAGFRLQDVR